MNEDILNNENFKRYYGGQMTSQEKAAFEAQVEQDPFAKEAMEGFADYAEKGSVGRLITRTETKIAEESGYQKQEGKVVPIYKIASIAASVLVLIGGFYFASFLLKPGQEIAQNDPTENLEEPTPTSEITELETMTLVTDSNAQDFFVDSAGQFVSVSEEPPPPPAIEIVEEVELEDEVNESGEQQLDLIQVSEPENIAVADMAAEEEELNFRDDNTTTIAVTGAVEPTVVSANKVAATSTEIVTEDVALSNSEVIQNGVLESNQISYNDALNSYLQGNHTVAIGQFEEAISNNDRIYESQYYIGMSYYALGKEQKAIKYFDMVISSPSYLMANAKWYKAEIYIKKGKIEDAKSILRNLINTNSTYSEQAEEKIKTL